MHVIKLALTMAALTMAALTGSLAASAQPVSPAASAPVLPPVAAVPSKLICRSSVETGSLIRQHKACFSAKQWHYVDDEHEREARKLVEDGTGKPNGN